jgi:hypothetical protein
MIGNRGINNMIQEISENFKELIAHKKSLIEDAKLKINDMKYTLEDMELVKKYVNGGPKLYPVLKLTKEQREIYDPLFEIKMNQCIIDFHEEMKCEENIPLDVDIIIGDFTIRKSI